MFYPESRDIYRYLWDGWQSLQGINPYEVVPGNTVFTGLDPHFNFVLTPYPPVAQGLFVIPAWFYQYISLGWARLVLVVPVFIVGILLWKRISHKWWWVFWLNPFIWIHLVRDSHIDSWAMMMAIAAGLMQFKNKFKHAGFFLGLAFLIKPYVGIWLPLFVKKGGWKLVVVFAVVVGGWYLPYRYSLERYVEFVNLMRQWQPGYIEPVGSLVTMAIVVGLLMFRKVSWSTLTVAGLAGLVLSPVIYPWYGLWLWPAALLSKKRWIVIITAIVLLVISPRA